MESAEVGEPVSRLLNESSLEDLRVTLAKLEALSKKAYRVYT